MAGLARIKCPEREARIEAAVQLCAFGSLGIKLDKINGKEGMLFAIAAA